MLPFEWRRLTKSTRLILIGIFVHVSLFLGVLDIYFSSSVEVGLPSYKSELVLADRVVVFVADGLRNEAIQDIHQDDYTPFLNTIRRTLATYGICYNHLPTESRPGHVAMFGGMYEDPSAILSGWKHNPIDVDNVFNQSTNSWLWGSPDIVPMFNKENLTKINVFAYDPSFEDFSGSKSTLELDRWVFDSVEHFFKNRSVEHCKAHCESLLGRGKIFFLHLLGMDTVGHIFKPKSDEYKKNLKYVDNGVLEMYQTFERFYNDKRTAYIFTSDHGMTDWGSHGSGSAHEIESPFIAWGSGIKEHQNLPININQSDIAPFISTLLGINIPINSAGLVPYQYLAVTKGEQVNILLSNVKQLGERFNAKQEKKIENTVLKIFRPFEKLNRQIFNHEINETQYLIWKTEFTRVAETSTLVHSGKLPGQLSADQGVLVRFLETGKHNLRKQKLDDLIDLIHEGDRYVSNFYKYPLLFPLTVGLLFWLVYLLTNVIPWQEYAEPRERATKRTIHETFIRCLATIIILLFILDHYEVEFKYCVYIIFPFIMSLPLILEMNQLAYLIAIIQNLPKHRLIINTAFCSIGFYMTIYAFYEPQFIALPVSLLFFWPFVAQTHFYVQDKTFWCTGIVCVCFYKLFTQLLEQVPIILGICGYIRLSYIIFEQLRDIVVRIENDRLPGDLFFFYILKMHIVLIFFATVSNGVYSLVATYPLFQHLICLFSWSLLFISLGMTVLSPNNNKLITRSFGISVSLYIIYTLMCVKGESVFLALFITLQVQWMYFEMHEDDVTRGARFVPPNYDSLTTFHDFRRCFFFIWFIFVSYFAVGNSADLNTFDPMWARQFVIVFNPFLSTAIILVKLTIPFLICTVFFQAINAYIGTSLINNFAIIMFYCDLLVLYFMYAIQNEGSWLHIGLSISRFVIVMVMIIFLLIFYGIAKFLTSNNLFYMLIPYFDYYIRPRIPFWFSYEVF